MSERANRNGGRPATSLFERLREAWDDITEQARMAVGIAPRPDLAREDADRLRGQIQACLEAVGGEVSARARAAEIGRTYLALNEEGRRRFLLILAQEFDTDRRLVDEACAKLASAGDAKARRAAERRLRHVLEPPRAILLTQFNALPEGVKFLVDMRAELLRLRREEPALAGLEHDLKTLLASWFDIGFLELRRITWQSPAALLEKLIAYEAVHAIQGWQDLKDRLDSDRRCFAFFHPSMPEEPLIFVEVALVDGMADDIQVLLDRSAPVGDVEGANTAIFYSISNAQQGLAGISFGGFLIKRVADVLTNEVKGVRTFATLSPIPGFMGWLEERAAAAEPEAAIAPSEAKALGALSPPVASLAELAALAKGQGWVEDEAAAAALSPVLMRLCAQYLLRAKRDGARARDPVAHFHLSNGARVERLNWLADRSVKGLAQSAGMMVNYQYRLGEIEQNHESYRGRGRISASSGVRGLARD